MQTSLFLDAALRIPSRNVASIIVYLPSKAAQLYNYCIIKSII